MAQRPSSDHHMPDPFDAYHIWLGIPPEEQPADHYRLLGIARFEAEPQVITLAAQRQMAHVKMFAVGTYAQLSQDILNQLARAKLCLLNPARKARYDLALREGLIAEANSARPTYQPVEKPRRKPPPLPAAKSEAALAAESAALRNWIIGSSPDCDVVVDLPTVSGRHCRLIQTEQGCLVEDLGSKNGTYVNGRKVTSQVPVSNMDSVWLGRSVRMPWPQDYPTCQARLLSIGAAPDNDIVLDLPIVSWHHAVIRIVGDLITIEDMNSTNGTAVGSPENWIRQSRLSPDDTVYFGSFAVSVAKLLEGRSS
jgi:pSer/pThr/pTyr-binding forkhead associated (FHA) protein